MKTEDKESKQKFSLKKPFVALFVLSLCLLSLTVLPAYGATAEFFDCDHVQARIEQCASDTPQIGDQGFHQENNTDSSLTDERTTIDEGTFASDQGPTNVRWTLFSSGELLIEGSGAPKLKVKWTSTDLSNRVISIMVHNSNRQIQPTQIDFGGFPNLIQVDVQYLNTDNTSDMSGAFSGDESLESLDLSGVNVSKVRNIQNMFKDCKKLSSLKLPNNLKDAPLVMASGMFKGCVALKGVDLPSLNLSDLDKTTGLSEMFSGCSSLKSLDLNGWNVSSVQNMQSLFEKCNKLEAIIVDKWNVEAVTNFSGIFAECRALHHIDVSQWKTSSAKTMHNMFVRCSTLNRLNLQNFDTHQVTDMGADSSQKPNEDCGMFANTRSLNEITLGPKWSFNTRLSLSCQLMEPNCATKRWEAVSSADGGTVKDPKGPSFTPKELAGFDKNVTETYVWQPSASYIITHYLVNYPNNGSEPEYDKVATTSGFAGNNDSFTAPAISADDAKILGYDYKPYYDDGQGHAEIRIQKLDHNKPTQFVLYYVARHYTLYYNVGGVEKKQARSVGDGLKVLSREDFDPFPVRLGFTTTGFKTAGGEQHFKFNTKGDICKTTGNLRLYVDWKPFLGLVINNQDDQKKALPNAKFQLLDKKNQLLDPKRFYTRYDYVNPDSKDCIPLDDWPVVAGTDGRASVIGLSEGTYYLFQIAPAGYDADTFDSNEATVSNENKQLLLDPVKIVVDSDGGVSVAGQDKEPDDKGNINLTITYFKTPNMPVTGFSQPIPFILLQLVSVLLLSCAAAYMIHRRRVSSRYF